MGYQIAKPNQFLVITGLGIENISIRKKAYVIPFFQSCTRFDTEPMTFDLTINAMSIEKLQFKLPVVFSIGVNSNAEAIQVFAQKFVSGQGEQQLDTKVRQVVSGLIEGEIRVLTASLGIEELFKSRKRFQDDVSSHIQKELNQYGLFMYNGNIKELKDADDSSYFKYLRMKAHEGAVNQAKIDVAEAKAKGDIGQREKEATAVQNIAQLNADTTAVQNTRQQMIKKSEADLQLAETELNKQTRLAQIRADQEAMMKEVELQKDVEMRRADLNKEKLRADTLAPAIIEAEKMKQIADAKLYQKQKESEASLYAIEKEAEGIQKLYKAQAEGIERIMQSFKDPQIAIQYLMMEKGVLQVLAAENAKAVQGMQPKITVWNTEASKGGDYGKPIRDIFSTLPPLLSTIRDQSNYEPPSWLGKFNDDNSTAKNPIETAVNELAGL